MKVSFSHFCRCETRVYDQIHRLVESGQGYEVSECALPQGCTPAVAALGFARRPDGYLLYFRPPVRYQGESSLLRTFFSRDSWRFSTFNQLAACLRGLRGAVEPAPKTITAKPLPPELPRTRRTPTAPVPPRRPPAADEWPPLYPRIRQALSERVMGQPRAVQAVAFKLCGHIGKKAPARPLSLIFHGPTGVGKSELAKAIPEALRACGEEAPFVWTELNTYTQPHSVYRLTGAPPGYVGYDDTPVFELVRRHPQAVFLFDELEKAHPEVLKVFLSVLDEGRCTARREDAAGGRELDFRRCVFVFTTNAPLSAPARRLGFGEGGQPEPPAPPEGEAETPLKLCERIFQDNERARQAMIREGVLAEVAGRFGALIGFSPLSETARVAVTARQIGALGREYGLTVEVAPETALALTPEGGALSARSSVTILEGLLTPLLLRASAAATGRRLLLCGEKGSLRLVAREGLGANAQ